MEAWYQELSRLICLQRVEESAGPELTDITPSEAWNTFFRTPEIEADWHQDVCESDWKQWVSVRIEATDSDEITQVKFYRYRILYPSHACESYKDAVQQFLRENSGFRTLRISQAYLMNKSPNLHAPYDGVAPPPKEELEEAFYRNCRSAFVYWQSTPEIPKVGTPEYDLSLVFRERGWGSESIELKWKEFQSRFRRRVWPTSEYNPMYRRLDREGVVRHLGGDWRYRTSEDGKVISQSRVGTPADPDQHYDGIGSVESLPEIELPQFPDLQLREELLQDQIRSLQERVERLERRLISEDQ